MMRSTHALGTVSALVVAFAMSGCSPVSTIDGTVQLLGGTLPASGLKVELTGDDTGSATVSASGIFKFPGLKSGTYTVSLSIPSTVEGTQKATVTIAKTEPVADVTLTFNGTGSISGVVTATYNPAEGATVVLADTNQTTTTAQDGSFSFTGVPVGSYWLSVTVANYGSRVSEPFPVAYAVNYAVPTLDLEMDLAEGGGAIRGTVLLGTAPAVGDTVAINSGGTSTTTDANGNFAFGPLGEGGYTLVITVPGSVEGTKTVSNVSVTEDAVTPVGTITFTPG